VFEKSHENGRMMKQTIRFGCLGYVSFDRLVAKWFEIKIREPQNS